MRVSAAGHQTQVGGWVGMAAAVCSQLPTSKNPRHYSNTSWIPNAVVVEIARRVPFKTHALCSPCPPILIHHSGSLVNRASVAVGLRESAASTFPAYKSLVDP